MTTKRLLSYLLLCVLLLSSALHAAGPKKLLQSQQSWDGGAFSYPQGKAEITSVKLHLTKGKTAPFHCHPVPTMGYIVKGQVQLETVSGKTAIYKAGDVVIEVMNTLHRGLALSDEAEIIVFYAGAVNMPTSIAISDQQAVEPICK